MAMQFIDLAAQQKRIKKQIDERIQTVLAHGCYILGPEVKELEEQLSSYVGVKHCISAASGTDALLMAEMVLGVGVGDEVITSSLTWVSTAETLALLGAKPVFVDIDPKTYNLDANLLEKAITPKTKAILPVSLYGQCADMTAINKIAKKHNLPVIEDAAQSFGATHHGKMSCGLSTIGCTSFFPAKPLGCYGDGGACFTNDDELAEKLRWVRVHGQKQRDDVRMIGINGRFDTLQAAILLEKFAIFPEEVKLRQEVATKYAHALKNVVGTPFISPENTSVYAQYTITTGKNVDRNAVKAHLSEKQIPSAIYYPVPVHLQPGYQYLGYKRGDLPHTEAVVGHILSLPMHPYLEDENIQQIALAVKMACQATASA